jgi:outer membrane protein TolC
VKKFDPQNHIVGLRALRLRSAAAARLLAAAAVLCVSLPLAALQLASQPRAVLPPEPQSTQTASPQALPSAPSAVLAAQDEALSRPPGSGVTFTAPGAAFGPGGLPVEQPQAAPLALSLDDAIALGLERNIRLRYDRGTERAVKGYTLNVVQAIIPNLKFDGQISAQEIDLAAMGFKASTLAEFASIGLLPPGYVFSNIVKVNTAQAQISASQTLFNLPDYELLRGTKNETAVVDLNTLSDEGDLVLTTGQAYLQVLADQSNLQNAQAQERSAETLFDQASDKFKAGVGIRLDSLRGQVEYQQRQQDTIAAQSRLEKDTIQLDRIMGLPAGQRLELTDTVPFAQMEGMDLAAAKLTAYAHRKDLLSLEQQIELGSRELRAVKFQRLPTLAFNGYYGVLGEIGSFYHGVFNVEGTLSIPIFREAAQRGEEQEVDAQLTSLRQREADLRVAIDAQIRSSMLDVTAADKLVQVARSNVALAQQALSDSRQRFTAGVDTDLPVVDAEATLTSAQANLVQSLFQYNVAKLQLARNTGVVETRYRSYLNK